MLGLVLLPALVLAAPISEATISYSDPLARNKLVFVAGAAYGTDPQQCLTKVMPGATLKRRVETYCDNTPGDKCVGYSAVSTADKAIILSFRGTNNNVQLIMEGLETVFAHNTPWAAGGNVSEYFNDGFSRVWNAGLKDDFNTLAASYPGYQLWITGHSLGGAMATLAASFITYNKLYDPSKTLLYTFGEPRVGDAAFVAVFDKTVTNGYRVTHNRDPVPHLPLKNQEGYTHHKAEVFYKEKFTSSYRICDDVDESSLCSNGNILPDSVLDDHYKYYNQDVSGLGYSNCQ